MYRPSNRRQSVSEKDKPGKKSPKKKKKSKICRATTVEEVDQQFVGTPESDRSQQSHSAETTENGTGTRFPSLRPSDRKSSAKEAAGVSLVVSPYVGSVGTVTESKSINTDLSESTISLLSSTGNSQTDLPLQAVARAYGTPVETLVQSLSALNVKTKSPSLQTDSPRNSRTNKSQQGLQGTLSSVRKSSGTVKHKKTNSAYNSKNNNQKLKQVDEKTKRPISKTVSNCESQRWEFAMEDLVQEEERLKIYKANRRKRYIAAAAAKGLHWASEYNTNGSPIASQEELICESNRSSISPERNSPSPSTVHSLAPVTVHTVRGKLVVECQ